VVAAQKLKITHLQKIGGFVKIPLRQNGLAQE